MHILSVADSRKLIWERRRQLANVAFRKLGNYVCTSMYNVHIVNQLYNFNIFVRVSLLTFP